MGAGLNSKVVSTRPNGQFSVGVNTQPIFRPRSGAFGR